MSKSSLVVIRVWREEDTEQVKLLFEAGMSSLIPYFLRSRIFKSLAGKSAWLALLGMLLLLPRFWIVECFAAMGWFGVQCVSMRRGFQGYIQNSQDGDLSSIHKTYLEKGGTFLVATVEGSSKIIGMIGGEPHNESRLEIRRVSVDANFQGNGLGRKIVDSLEAFARKNGYQTLFLYVSSEQYAANALYSKMGFVCIEQSKPRFMSGVSFLTLEKSLKQETCSGVSNK